MNGRFNVGDVVKLKSGGPPMTVKEISSGGQLKCTWFDSGNVQSNFFPAETLEAETDSSYDPSSDNDDSAGW